MTEDGNSAHPGASAGMGCFQASLPDPAPTWPVVLKASGNWTTAKAYSFLTALRSLRGAFPHSEVGSWEPFCSAGDLQVTHGWGRWRYRTSPCLTDQWRETGLLCTFILQSPSSSTLGHLGVFQ